MSKEEKNTVPKYGDELRTIIVGFKLTQSESDELEAFCKKMDVTKSRLLRHITLIEIRK